MPIQHPPYLQPGATIGITCPSGYVSEDRAKYAIEILNDWGFKVKLGNTIGTGEYYFSGTDEERRADLQMMLDDAEVDAILMGRGGYGMSRIIDQLDFTAFKNKPKWICGFSDITVLHSHLQATMQPPTLHSPMCGAFKPETAQSEYLLSLKKALTGEDISYTFPASDFNRQGDATGIITGGNLAMLAHLSGSVSAVDTADKILFIEDIGEYKYNIDRMLMNLKRAGMLDNLKALIIGSFTDTQDTERPFGQSVEEIIWDKVKEYTYPVCFNFPCGHQEINYTLCLGMMHKLTVDKGKSALTLLR